MSVCATPPPPNMEIQRKNKVKHIKMHLILYTTFWKKSIGKLKIYGALNFVNSKNNGQNYTFSFLLSKLPIFLDTLKSE